MDRSNHYEAAFEAYLQWRRICYIAVDETRRSYLGDSRIKSLDFIVHAPNGTQWLVDVKGRRYPGGPAERTRPVWECWSPREDIHSLQAWAERFGAGYRAMLVFMYHWMPYGPPIPENEEIWTWHDAKYLLRGVAVDEYGSAMRVRSPKWETVGLATADFQRLARPLHLLLDEQLVPAEPCWDDVPF